MLIPKIGGLHNHISQHISQPAPIKLTLVLKAVGHPWPPCSPPVDNPLLLDHWRQLHSLPHISHCCKVHTYIKHISHSLYHISHCCKVQAGLIFIARRFYHWNPNLADTLCLNIIIAIFLAPLILLLMMMSRDARGAYRYLRLLINVWFYEKLDLTVPQVSCLSSSLSCISVRIFLCQDYSLLKWFLWLLLSSTVTDHNDAIIKMMMASTPCLGVSAHSPKTPKQGLPSLWRPGNYHHDDPHHHHHHHIGHCL